MPFHTLSGHRLHLEECSTAKSAGFEQWVVFKASRHVLSIRKLGLRRSVFYADSARIRIRREEDG
jgi:hypothetical protein